MKKILKQNYFELAVFCMDYHSGQWSRGYRILSRLQPFHIADSDYKELRESEVYQYLVANYADKI